jgi:hypothetical protein
MFGASEDRARQLAGRQRWKRISSSGSSSSYRSASSSSQLSQLSHCETSYIFEHNPQRPTPIPEHPSPTRFVSIDSLHDLGGLQYLVQPIAASDVEEAFSRMVSKNLHPQTLHQRSQTEYLSRVLYDHTTPGHALPPPTIPSAVSGQTKQYGVLGWGAKIRQQVRHFTEPASPVRIEGHLSTVVTVHDLTSRSVSSDNISTQAIPSMRGGAGPEPRFPWTAIQQHQLWDCLFNTGAIYHSFISWLRRHRSEDYALFVSLFDNSYGLEADPVRQHLLLTLGTEARQTIRGILLERAKAILGSALFGGSQSPTEIQRILTESLQDTEYPAIKPRHLFLTFVNTSK